MLLTLVLMATGVKAESICFDDINGDGEYTDSAEIQSCFGDDEHQVCPIEAHRCVGLPGQWTCPIPGNRCVENKLGRAMCSSRECVDLDEVPVVSHELEYTMYVDDGPKDSNGNCLGQVMMFSGRVMECHPPGLSNAWQNCCRHSGEVIQDTVGSFSEIGMGVEAIKHIYKAVKAGYVAFDAARQAGQTVAQSAQAGAGAAGNSLVAFDPASLAMTVAITLVLDYLTQACSPTDLETALLKSSGFCHELHPQRCSKSVLGECVQKTRVFCCFNSKLSRIINESGREQLADLVDFGDSTSPDCRGFTPEEFQSIDFSKIDLTEYYEDLRHDSAEVIQAGAEQKVRAYEQQFIID